MSDALFHELRVGCKVHENGLSCTFMICLLFFMLYVKSLSLVIESQGPHVQRAQKTLPYHSPKHLKTTEERAMTREPQTCGDFPGDPGQALSTLSAPSAALT